MRQLLLVLSLAVVVIGCASHPLVPKEQAEAIKNRDRALAPHSAAIQDTIRQSGNEGALAFLDAGDGHLVVLPGDSPGEAWARHIASPSGRTTGRASMPPVFRLVYRANVANAKGLRKVAAASQEVSANSAKLADTMRQLSENLASQLKELAARLDAIQERISNVK